MNRRRTTIATLGLALVIWGQAAAQNTSALGSGPLALDAADGVEWRREERLFIAEGNAVARQGDITLSADRLVAAYREAAGGKLEIFRVDAEGDVRLQNGKNLAAGARAAFDLEGRAVLLSGPGLRYQAGDVEVTATDTLEYLVDDRRAVARGDARVRHPRGELSADIIEARLKAGDAAGVAVARAWGAVAIRTDAETIRADQAEYDFDAQKATAAGNVRIARGGDVLTGDRATVDLRSGVSRLSGGGAGGKRVQGLVFPKAKR